MPAQASTTYQRSLPSLSQPEVTVEAFGVVEAMGWAKTGSWIGSTKSAAGRGSYDTTRPSAKLPVGARRGKVPARTAFKLPVIPRGPLKWSASFG